MTAKMAIAEIGKQVKMDAREKHPGIVGTNLKVATAPTRAASAATAPMGADGKRRFILVCAGPAGV